MIARLFIIITILIGLVFGGYWAYEASKSVVFISGFSGSSTYTILFETHTWAIPVAIFLGILVGAFAKKKEKVSFKNGKVLRHDETMFFQHWGNVIACILLMGTGITLGLLFFPRLITGPENIGFTINLHFIGVILFLFIIFFHVTSTIMSGEMKEHLPKAHDIPDAIGHYKAKFTKSKKPEEGKYFASERLSYPVWGVVIGGLIFTGLLKVSAYIFNMPEALMGVVTLFHGIFTVGMVLLLVVHVLLSAVIPSAWPMIRSMITGYMKEEVVKENHEKWYKEIKENEQQDKKSDIA